MGSPLNYRATARTAKKNLPIADTDVHSISNFLAVHRLATSSTCHSSSIPPVRFGVMTLPSLSSASCGLVEPVSFAQTTRFLAGCSKTSRLTVLF